MKALKAQDKDLQYTIYYLIDEDTQTGVEDWFSLVLDEGQWYYISFGTKQHRVDWWKFVEREHIISEISLLEIVVIAGYPDIERLKEGKWKHIK